MVAGPAAARAAWSSTSTSDAGGVARRGASDGKTVARRAGIDVRIAETRAATGGRPGATSVEIVGATAAEIGVSLRSPFGAVGEAPRASWCARGAADRYGSTGWEMCSKSPSSSSLMRLASTGSLTERSVSWAGSTFRS